jgi:hypothetical protein
VKGAPREADQRRRAEFGHQEAHRLGDVGDVTRLQRHQPVEVSAGPHRLGHDRTGARHDVEVDADRGQRNDDVAEEDRRVDAVPPHRLQRDLGDQFGPPTGLQHGDPLADRAILRQRTTGLTHEPDRRSGAGAPPGSGQEETVGRRRVAGLG